jgi:3'(2'), 5'-bisphosphate nucleotidase
MTLAVVNLDVLERDPAIASDDLASALAEGLLAPVLAAGRMQLSIRLEGAVATVKGDESLVTRADHDSEAIIAAALARLCPGIPVVAEEAMYSGTCPIAAATAGRFFLVDPLDGTREYVAGGDDFTVNIALIDGGRPVFGLIYAPALSELYVTLGRQTAVQARVAATS